MKRLVALILNLLPFFGISQPDNYLSYHQSVRNAEEHIVNKRFRESLDIYLDLSKKYDYTFLRDCKVAAQLAAYTGDKDNLFYFLEKGMKKGWTLKQIKKSKYIKKFKTDQIWRKLKGNQ